MTIIFLVLYGGLIGSFINALTDRIATGESIKTNRSHCDSCGHVLGVKDLIPVLSWLVLRGTCRYCGAKIPVRNLLIELITIGLFLITYTVFSPMFETYGIVQALVLFILMLVVVSELFALVVYDIQHQILPDRIMVTLLGSVTVLQLATYIMTDSFLFGMSIQNIVLSSIGSALPYLIIILVTKGAGMGGGDLKLAFVMGLLLGYPRVLFAQYLAFLLGGLVAVVLLVGGKKRFGQAVAFGPFMVVGTYITLFWGDLLIQQFVHWLP